MIGVNQGMKRGNVGWGITSNDQGSEKLKYESTKRGIISLLFIITSFYFLKYNFNTYNTTFLSHPPR